MAIKLCVNIFRNREVVFRPFHMCPEAGQQFAHPAFVFPLEGEVNFFLGVFRYMVQFEKYFIAKNIGNQLIAILHYRPLEVTKGTVAIVLKEYRPRVMLWLAVYQRKQRLPIEVRRRWYTGIIQ